MKQIDWSKRLYGIQRKLMFYMMSLILLALLLVAAGISMVAGNTVRRNMVEQYSYVSEKFYTAFQSMYQNLEAVTESCITNSNVQKSLTNQELGVYDREIISKTLQFVDGGDVDYYVYMDNKENIYTRKSDGVTPEEIKESYIYQGMGEDYSRVKLFFEQDVLAKQTAGSNAPKVLYVGRYIRQMDREYAPGVLYLKMKQTVFDDLAAQTGDEVLTDFLLDSKGQICYRRNGSVRGKYDQTKDIKQAVANLALSEDQAEATIVSGHGVLYVHRHGDSGFTAASYLPNEVIYQMVWQMLWVIVLIFAVVVAVAFGVSRYIAERITRPIRYISTLMENFDDSGLNSLAVVATNTELDDIGSSYNKMLVRISDLLEQVTFKERELRKAELDTLMYQIHPHFLYNTLDTVYMLARISKEETIMEMIQALSKYLRINLSNGAEEIPISKEVENVRAYLDIQNIRKGGLFTYDISIDPLLEETPVLKMILQPIAENCIKHAFDGEEEDLRIHIRVKQFGEDVVITIANNGTRMPEKEKDRLNRLERVEIGAIDSVVTRSEHGFGIWNVVKRLRLRYQEQIRFYYVLSADQTTCVIKIKKELMKSNEEENSGSIH